jgi:hypothetical protein
MYYASIKHLPQTLQETLPAEAQAVYLSTPDFLVYYIVGMNERLLDHNGTFTGYIGYPHQPTDCGQPLCPSHYYIRATVPAQPW